MIQASNISLRFGKKALFEEVNIKFTEGNCYGIIGANGAGKSTFLKILSGELEPTTGEISLGPGQRLSVLEQDHFKYDADVVLDTVIAGNQRLYDSMKEKDAIKDMCLPPFDRANEMKEKGAIKDMSLPPFDRANEIRGDNNIYIKLIKDLYRLPKYIAKYLRRKYLKTKYLRK